MSYKKRHLIRFFQVSNIQFKHFQFDSEYDSAGELEGNNERSLYQWEKGKGINQNKTFNNYEVDLALKLLRKMDDFQYDFHSRFPNIYIYLINLLILKTFNTILRELLD